MRAPECNTPFVREQARPFNPCAGLLDMGTRRASVLFLGHLRKSVLCQAPEFVSGSQTGTSCGLLAAASEIGRHDESCNLRNVVSPRSLSSEKELFKRNRSSRNAPLLQRQFVSKPQRCSVDEETQHHEYLDFPGARVRFCQQMKFMPEAPDEPVPCLRVLDELGQELEAAQFPEVDQSLATTMYKHMVTLQTMDIIFYEAQRQGRFNFYMTTRGEEAINIASAAALSNDDMVFAQYREPGSLLWRGFTLQEFANQCFGNAEDYGKGRQMPIHYGSRKLNYSTISSPIATQLPQAVGAAYALKMSGKAACAVTYLGDGASSEGDFHGAMNFAAVLEAPVLFICRNNGWAISTPSTEQYKGDGLIARGLGYGMKSIRVDGNDTLAVYATVKEARRIAIEESRPVFIEALTYRVGHHSTSDDSSKYRSGTEIEHWRDVRDPVLRFRRWMERKGWWNAQEETQKRAEARKQVLAAMAAAESKAKPALSNLFTDVYESIPANLREQEETLRGIIARHPAEYPGNVPV